MLNKPTSKCKHYNFFNITKGEKMKRLIHFTSFIAIISIIVISCGAPVQPGAAEGSEEQEQQSAVDATPTLETIDLAGPPMEVGSTYRYVDGTLLVAVPGGKFIMGGDKEDNPVHEVTVSDFWIYSTKVTNSQYAGCVAAGHCTPPDPDNNPIYNDYKFINFPVTGVTHTQAAEYCEYVNGRLPTEAEWEKAARGTYANEWPWGNEFDQNKCNSNEGKKGGTTPVGAYSALGGDSPYGCADMVGNVWEWMHTLYKEYPYNAKDGREDEASPNRRVLRGGSFHVDRRSARCASRYNLSPDDRYFNIGFRICVSPITHL